MIKWQMHFSNILFIYWLGWHMFSVPEQSLFFLFCFVFLIPFSGILLLSFVGVPCSPNVSTCLWGTCIIHIRKHRVPLPSRNTSTISPHIPDKAQIPKSRLSPYRLFNSVSSCQFEPYLIIDPSTYTISPFRLEHLRNLWFSMNSVTRLIGTPPVPVWTKSYWLRGCVCHLLDPLTSPREKLHDCLEVSRGGRSGKRPGVCKMLHLYFVTRGEAGDKSVYVNRLKEAATTCSSVLIGAMHVLITRVHHSHDIKVIWN